MLDFDFGVAAWAVGVLCSGITATAALFVQAYVQKWEVE